MKDKSELRGSCYFMFNNVPGDFRRQREWKSHMGLLNLSQVPLWPARGRWNAKIHFLGLGIRLDNARQKETDGRHTMRSIDAAATCPNDAERERRGQEQVIINPL